MKYQNLYSVNSYQKDPLHTKGNLHPLNNITDTIFNLNDLSNNNELEYAFLGHSSVFIKINDKKILIDPVFSDSLGPIDNKLFKRFKGVKVKPSDFDNLDLVLISHAHYDHLDFKTLKLLDEKVKQYVVPMGIKDLMIKNKIDRSKIIELNWYGHYKLDDLEVICTPAHHNAFRDLFSQNTLWCSFVIKNHKYQIYHSGDSAYSKHFLDINKLFSNFDLVFIECGQYGALWHEQHMFPEESVKACIDLNAQMVVPIHWGAYVLSNHPYDEPINRFIVAAQKEKLNYLIPTINKMYQL